MARSLSERLAGLEKSTAEKVTLADQLQDLPPAPDVHLTAPGLNKLPVAQEGLSELGFLPVAEHGYFVRVLRYDALTKHGHRRFADVLRVDLQRLVKATKLAKQPTRLVFYDTETTGLGTGAGTFPFLHAVGQFEEDEFVLYQYFLIDYGAEGQMLEEIRDRHFTGDDTAVVTFNGKSFDWPLLRNRFVLHRRRLLPEPGQIDLLHPSRRLWKKSLPRVNLSGVENHVLGLTRTDDVPGKEAPARYFAYLEQRKVAIVQPVFEHNAMDVCSLVALTAVIADTLNGDLPIERAAEYVVLGRWFDEWQEHDQAKRCFVAATACEDADWTAFWLYSLHYKRAGDWDEAVRVWTKMAARYRWSTLPVVELAKYAEHQKRDYVLAEEWTLEALQRMQLPGEVLGNKLDHVRESLSYRLERIRKKSTRKAGLH